MEITINFQYYSKIFLELLTNQSFKQQFQANAPEIYADIESAYNNPNCSCRAKIEAYVNNNKEKLHPFLVNYIKANEITLNLQEIEQKFKITPYTGKIDRVKISEWSEYAQNIVKIRASFRNFSVVKLDDEYINVFYI